MLRALAAGSAMLVAACGGATYDREPHAHGRRPPTANPARLSDAPFPTAASSASAATPSASAAPSASAWAGSGGPSASPSYPPVDFPPLHARTAKPGDGTWRSLASPPNKGADAKPYVVTTTVHPDPIKAFVEVAIVALDTSRLQLQLVSGTDEPENAAIGKDKRPGVVAPGDLGKLVLATNGGYKARHGRHGMRVGADVFVPARPDSCTIARRADDRMYVGAWSKVSGEENTLKWFRQGPPCLIEGGALHPDLASEYGRKKWGAAEDGKKDIRRSAYALGPGGTLYFAIGEWTTADLLAHALRAAGVTDAVQMDINWSFTRFVLYGRDGGGEPVASSPILEKLKFGPREYWQKASERDFFYAIAK